MTVLKCADCGHVFRMEEQARWKEDGEILEGCPLCYGPAYEAFQCQCCDGWFLDEDLDEGLCSTCEIERRLNE